MGIRQSRSHIGASSGLTGKTTLGSLLKENGKLFSGVRDKADILGRKYESVYTHEDVSSIPESVEETLSTNEGAPCICGRCHEINLES